VSATTSPIFTPSVRYEPAARVIVYVGPAPAMVNDAPVIAAVADPGLPQRGGDEVREGERRELALHRALDAAHAVAQVRDLDVGADLVRLVDRLVEVEVAGDAAQVLRARGTGGGR
jgi:hypothetical protein